MAETCQALEAIVSVAAVVLYVWLIRIPLTEADMDHITEPWR